MPKNKKSKKARPLTATSSQRPLALGGAGAASSSEKLRDELCFPDKPSKIFFEKANKD